MIEKIDWEIVDNDSLGIVMQTIPEVVAVNYYFTGINIVSYPKMISSVSKRVGFGSNSVGVNFPEDLDPGDQEIPKGFVEIYHLDFGSSVIKEQLFYQMLVGFSQRLYEFYKHKNEMDSDWENAMVDSIQLLKSKVKIN